MRFNFFLLLLSSLFFASCKSISTSELTTETSSPDEDYNKPPKCINGLDFPEVNIYSSKKVFSPSKLRHFAYFLGCIILTSGIVYADVGKDKLSEREIIWHAGSQLALENKPYDKKKDPNEVLLDFQQEDTIVLRSRDEKRKKVYGTFQRVSREMTFVENQKEIFSAKIGQVYSVKNQTAIEWKTSKGNNYIFYYEILENENVTNDQDNVLPPIRVWSNKSDTTSSEIVFQFVKEESGEWVVISSSKTNLRWRGWLFVFAFAGLTPWLGTMIDKQGSIIEDNSIYSAKIRKANLEYIAKLAELENLVLSTEEVKEEFITYLNQKRDEAATSKDIHSLMAWQKVKSTFTEGIILDDVPRDELFDFIRKGLREGLDGITITPLL